MKKYIKLKTILILTVITTFFYISCNKKFQEKKCTSCQEDGQRGLKLSYKIFDKYYLLNGYGDFIDLNENCFSFTKSNEIQANELLQLAGLENKLNESDGKLSSINLIVKNNSKVNKLIKNDDILGVLLYFNQNNFLYTKTFLKESNQYNLVPIFSKNTRDFAPRDIRNVYSILLQESNKWSIFSFLIQNNFPKIEKSILQNDLQIEINKRINKSRAINNPGEKTCTAPCMYGPPKTYCYFNPLVEMFECRDFSDPPPPVCVSALVINLLRNNNMHLTELDSQINLLYSFRDSFMNLSTKGQNYIFDYYYVGKHFQGLNMQYSIASWNLLQNKVNPIIQKLMRHEFKDSIIYDSNTANEIIDFVNYSKNNISDSVSISKLDLFIADILKYENKTVRFVIDDLQ